MTKQFLQETNFQDEPQDEMPEQRAKDQVLRNRWTQKELEEIIEED